MGVRIGTVPYTEIAIYTATVLMTEPGLRANTIAKRLGVNCSTVLRALSSMDKVGTYLYEDDKRRLYLYKQGDKQLTTKLTK